MRGRGVDAVFKEFGGTRPLARALGIPVSTAAGWKNNGVPEWRWPQIEAARAARNDFKDLTDGNV